MEPWSGGEWPTVILTGTGVLPPPLWGEWDVVQLECMEACAYAFCAVYVVCCMIESMVCEKSALIQAYNGFCVCLVLCVPSLNFQNLW